MRRAIYLTILAAVTSACALLYLGSNFVVYRRVPGDEGIVPKEPRPPHCRDWHHLFLYAARPGSGDSTPLNVSCEEALALPGQDYYPTNQLGMRIRYRLFAQQFPGRKPEGELTEDSKANSLDMAHRPIWLHIHGITGDMLAGARYVHAAARLGMQMAAMELSNHGLSDNNGAGATWGCREQFDVVAVVADLLDRFPNRDLLISASSMGTMALANAEPRLRVLAESDRIIAFAMENPIPSLSGLFAHSPIPGFGITAALALGRWETGYDVESCAPRKTLPQLRTPTIVQHGGQDTNVPAAEVRQFYKLLPANLMRRLIIYPQGTHLVTWNAQPEEFEQDLGQFFQEARKLRGALPH